MRAVWMWFRIGWRTRWRALVGLVLLIVFATGTVEATFAGARRGATAVDRLLDVTDPITVAVTLNQGRFDWNVVRALPEVASVSAFAVTSYAIEGLPDGPHGLDDVGGFPFVDDEIWNTIERPVVLRGRLPDPTRADEVVVSPKFVDHFHRGVGDTVTLHLYTAEQLDSFDQGPPMGPTIEATIVGEIRSLWFRDEAGNALGGLSPSPGLYAQYPDNIVGTTASAANINAAVRLRHEGAGIDEFEREFTRATGIENADLLDMNAKAEHLRGVTSFESRALTLLGLTALMASMALIGVAISRFVAASFSDLEVLEAFGFTPGQSRAAIVAGPGSASAIAVVLGGAVAWWASRWFPVGTAGLMEPSPGASFDGLVLLPPIIIVPALVAGVGVVALQRRAAASRRANTTISPLDSITATLPLRFALGTRFALSGRSTRNSASARPALIGAVLGVTGVVAALTFAHGIADATDGYSRFGQTYDLYSWFGAGGQDFVDAPATLTTIADDPGVAGVIDARNDAANSESGPVSLYTYAPVGAPVDAVVTDGRLPRTPSEIALAPLSSEAAGLSVGDTIELTGSRATRTLTVTGLAFVPAGPHNDYASGGWVLPDAFDDLFDGFRFHFALVSTTRDADPQTVADRLAAHEHIQFGHGPIQPPVEHGELAELRTLPLLLAVFLAVLAVGAVGHTLASTARRRRRDVAMLRALGMGPHDSGAIVFVQAGVIACVGLVVGLPLGVMIGRTIWRTVALDTPVQFVRPDRWPTDLAVALVVTSIAALLSIWPSRRLVSMPLATELRSE